MKRREKQFRTAAVMLTALMWLLPLGASSQTVRGDFNYDGEANISDLTTLINYVLTEEWNDMPTDVVRDTLNINGVPLIMVRVEGGTISAGEGITMTVGSFSIGQTEVTQELWKTVMGYNPSMNKYEGSPFLTDTISPVMPVEQVSWDACQEFVAALNELTGLTFSLPTSREWEFAARGGVKTCGYRYAGGNLVATVAWCASDVKGPGQLSHRIALLLPNELGLYDMSGNVEEWCLDAGSNQKHVLRGGSTYYYANQCEVSHVGYGGHSEAYGWRGLRLVLHGDAVQPADE